MAGKNKMSSGPEGKQVMARCLSLGFPNGVARAPNLVLRRELRCLGNCPWQEVPSDLAPARAPSCPQLNGSAR